LFFINALTTQEKHFIHMKIINSLEKLNQPTAVAIGYFDGVHIGHRAVIAEAVNAARDMSAVPAVVTFDMSSQRATGKGSGDVFTRSQKIDAISKLGIELFICPDFLEIAPMTGEDFLRKVFKEKYNTTCICCGSQFRFGKGRACGPEEMCRVCEELGIKCIIVSDVEYLDEPVSSTRIKDAIAWGDMKSAAHMLGANYSLDMPVYEDKHLARRLGFPTINQRFPKGIVAPRFGVYYTKVEIDGAVYGAVTNFGIRPSVSDDNNIAVETHILNYSGELYGRDVTIEFVEFMRDEKKFADEAELIDTVNADIKRAFLMQN